MAKRVATKGKPKQYKETNPRRVKRTTKRAKCQGTDYDIIAPKKPLLPRLYGDPLREGIEEIGLPDPALERETMDDIGLFALGYFQEFASRVKQRCSDDKVTHFDRRMACELFVYMVGQATKLVHYLMLEFKPLFRQVAEGWNQFPCMFPAHPGSLRRLQKRLWDDFGLGKHNPLRLRPAPGRKTFSFETWANQLLFHYIGEIHYKFAIIASKKSAPDFETVWLVEIQLTPEIARQVELLFKDALPPGKNAKQWLDVIWQLLLSDTPEPETDPRLRQLGGRPSKVHDVRATIKAKLGTYLKRMLNESDRAVHE